MKHLNIIELLRTVNDPSDAKKHLNECDVCLERFVTLKEFKRAASHAGFLSPAKRPDCPATEELAAFIDGVLTGSDANDTGNHLKECDRCFDYASYYVSEAQQMRTAKILSTPEKFKAAALALVPPKAVKTERAPVRKWRIPKTIARLIFPPLPVYAAAVVFLFTLNIFSGNTNTVISAGKTSYSLYRGEAGKIPLLHFDGSGEVVGQANAGMRVESSGRGLHFRWRGIEGAMEYFFVLQEMKNGAPKTVRQFSTVRREAILPRGIFVNGAQYRWISAGKLPDNRYFMASIDFRLP